MEAARIRGGEVTDNHPILPKDIIVKGYIIDSETGELRRVEEGKDQSILSCFQSSMVPVFEEKLQPIA